MGELRGGPDLRIPGRWFLSFALPRGTTYEQAAEMAAFMKRHLEPISLTQYQADVSTHLRKHVLTG
jgi:hypothetical protein